MCLVARRRARRTSGHAIGGCTHLGGAHLDRFREPIESPGKPQERGIALTSDPVHDRRDTSLERAIAHGLPLE
jgi:hypothetical protein